MFANARTVILIGIAFLIVVALFPLGFVAPLSALDSSKQPGGAWVMFVYNYQALIAGALAIVAALITVWGMRQIDEAQADRQRQLEDAQAERHRELIKLGLRSEIIKLERAINPQLYLLKAERIKLASIDLSLASYKDLPGDPQRLLLSAVCREYLVHANGVQVLLEREQFVEAIPLFDGDLMLKLDVLRKKLGDVLDPLREHVIAIDEDEMDIYYEERLDSHIDGLLKDMARLPLIISNFTDSFDRFREKNSI